MIAICCLDENLVRLFSAGAVDVAVTAGKIQGNLGEGNTAISRELPDLEGVDSHHVSTQVASERIGISQGAPGDARHVAINALRERSVDFNSAVSGFFEVAALAGSAYSRLVGLA